MNDQTWKRLPCSRLESLECLSRKTGQHEKGKWDSIRPKECHIHQGIISMRTEKATTSIYCRDSAGSDQQRTSTSRGFDISPKEFYNYISTFSRWYWNRCGPSVSRPLRLWIQQGAHPNQRWFKPLPEGTCWLRYPLSCLLAPLFSTFVVTIKRIFPTQTNPFLYIYSFSSEEQPTSRWGHYLFHQ